MISETLSGTFSSLYAKAEPDFSATTTLGRTRSSAALLRWQQGWYDWDGLALRDWRGIGGFVGSVMDS